MFNVLFIGQLSQDVRKKLRKLDGAEELSVLQLTEIGYKVSSNSRGERNRQDEIAGFSFDCSNRRQEKSWSKREEEVVEREADVPLWVQIDALFVNRKSTGKMSAMLGKGKFSQGTST